MVDEEKREREGKNTNQNEEFYYAGVLEGGLPDRDA